MDQIAEIILEKKVFEIDFKKQFRFASGKVFPFYCDNRILLSMPKERDIIVNAFAKKISDEKIIFSVVAGIATASIPWAAMLAAKLSKPLIYVRKESKDHGKGKRIEGSVKKGEKVLLIEDLISTGGSSLDAVHVLRESGLKVDYCLGIFTYNIGNVLSKFSDENVNLITLTDINEVLGVAVKKGKIDEKQRKEIVRLLGNSND